MKNILFILLSLLTICGYSQTQISTSSQNTVANINTAIKGSINAIGTDTYTATMSGFTWTSGQAMDITFVNANTGTSTFNLNGAGALTLKKESSGSLVDLVSGDIIAGARKRFYHNGTYLVMQSGGGGGTVTSVSGTANQIASTGGTTPVLSIVTNPILPGAPTIVSPGNSTQNIITTDATQTLSNKTLVAPALGTIASGDGAALTNVVNSVTGDGVGGTSDNPVIDITSARTLTTSGAIVQSDNLHIIYLNSSSPFNVTVDALTINSQVSLINIGTSIITLLNGSGVSFSGPSTINPGEAASVIYRGSTTPLVRTGGTIPDASTTVKGIAKLYTSTGSNTDGAMDQNSATTAINAKVADAINDGTTTIAPSQNAVFDALALKQSSSLTSANIFVGNGSNIATGVPVSGDITISNAGVVAIGSAKVTNAMLAGSIDLTSKVTGVLPIANGGTNSTVGAWLLSGTSTLSGASTITSNTASGLTFNGAFTTTANSQFTRNYTGTYTLRNTASDEFNSTLFNPLLVASAASQVITGVKITPTFTPGAFSPTMRALWVTGVSNGTVFYCDNNAGTQLMRLSNAGTLVLGNSADFTTLTPGTRTLTFGGISDWGNAAQYVFQSGNYAGTSGTGTVFRVSGAPFAPASGTANYVNTEQIYTINQTSTASGNIIGLLLDPTYTAALGNVTGIDYNPTVTSITGSHIFSRNTSGSFLVGGTTLTASTRFDQRGLGTTSSTINHRWANSSNTLLASLTDDGNWTMNGKISFDATITAGGTTGDRTINKPSGTVNIAAAGTTVTVTNSFCTTSSIIELGIRTNDATAWIKNYVPSNGSFVINLGAAATSEISIGFVVKN